MTEIKLHNTLTRQKEVLKPLDESNVRMYVCGPTVYDRAHIGNARPAVIFDVLNRLLRHRYGDENVTYVRNITDVDDKINARAAETGRSIRGITDETLGWYHDDMAAIGVAMPDHEPRATEWIAAMTTMIADLIAKGHAYAAEGHVLFAVDSYARYGKLSNRSLDEMIEGARVEVAPYKRNPMDFVLWKPSDGATPGWDSPWGRGRPGWHIECSAMAKELLGETFDIHGGGVDLAFPHHENELAQSNCAHGTEKMAQIWMHNGFLQVEGEKMSKSLGNFFTVRDLLDQGVPGEVIRFVLLSTHYRKPMDWTAEKAREAQETLKKWYQLAGAAGVYDQDDPELISALSDDLNTPRAIAACHRLASAGDVGQLARNMKLLGFDPLDAPEWARSAGFTEAEAAVVHDLLRIRDDARRNKDFAKADTIRDGLKEAGVEVRDTGGESEIQKLGTFDANILDALCQSVDDLSTSEATQ